MGNIIRAVTSDGSVVAYAIDSTDIVDEAIRIHGLSPVAAAALGRLLSVTAMMGVMLKGPDDSVTVRLKGGGPLGTVMAVADGAGNVRGLTGHPGVELPLRADGKLDVGAAVGRDGTVSVAKDLNLKEPYCGQTPLVSGEVAEDMAQYFALSEQVPTVCALGVLVDTDYTCRAAGGFLIQPLPFCGEEEIRRLERNVAKLRTVTQMLFSGLDAQGMLREALDGFDFEVIGRTESSYVCNCSRQRVAAALRGMGAAELRSMAQEQGGAEVSCHFCGQVYNFSAGELLALGGGD